MEFGFSKIQFEHNRLFLLLNSKFNDPNLQQADAFDALRSRDTTNHSTRIKFQKESIDQELFRLLQMMPNLLPLEFPLNAELQDMIQNCVNYRLSMGKLQYYLLLFENSVDGNEGVCGHVFRNGEPVYRCL